MLSSWLENHLHTQDKSRKQYKLRKQGTYKSAPLNESMLSSQLRDLLIIFLSKFILENNIFLFRHFKKTFEYNQKQLLTQ